MPTICKRLKLSLKKKAPIIAKIEIPNAAQIPYASPTDIPPFKERDNK